MSPRRLTLALAAALLLPACGEQAKEKTKEIGHAIGEKAGATWASIRDFTVEKKDQAVEFFSKSKDALAEDFEKVKAKSADWSEGAKESLDHKWEQVQQTYAKAKDATGEGWATARDAFKAAVDAFKQELEKHRE
ncbi:MAG: hypothetical protein AB7T63_05795 [Planctomycetota bacterium]